MSERQTQRTSGKIIEAIIEKLLPWYRIKWLGVGMLSQTVRIRVLGMDVAVGLCPDESFQVESLEPHPNAETLYHIKRLEAILNGAVRDEEGHLVEVLLHNNSRADGSVGVCTKSEEPPKEPEPQYRTPHPGDVGKRIEVRDSEDLTSDDSAWVERTLVAVLAFPNERPQGEFVTAVEGYDAKQICNTWKYARIKVENPESPKNQGHPDHLEGVWVEEAGKAEPAQRIPKVGDKVRVVAQDRVLRGKVGVVVTKRGRKYDVEAQGVADRTIAWGLTAKEIEIVEAAQ